MSNVREEVQKIFDERNDSRKEEWVKIRDDFIVTAIQSLIDEQIDGLAFHVVYDKVSRFSDEEILEHLLEEL